MKYFNGDVVKFEMEWASSTVLFGGTKPEYGWLQPHWRISPMWMPKKLTDTKGNGSLSGRPLRNHTSSCCQPQVPMIWRVVGHIERRWSLSQAPYRSQSRIRIRLIHMGVGHLLLQGLPQWPRVFLILISTEVKVHKVVWKIESPTISKLSLSK